MLNRDVSASMTHINVFSRRDVFRNVQQDANGRSGRARTCDTRFWRPVLYQLSYTPAEASCDAAAAFS